MGGGRRDRGVRGRGGTEGLEVGESQKGVGEGQWSGWWGEEGQG